MGVEVWAGGVWEEGVKERVEHVQACLWCGVVRGKEKHVFCQDEMDAMGVECVKGFERHVHRFAWAKIVHGWFGEGIPAP